MALLRALKTLEQVLEQEELDVRKGGHKTVCPAPTFTYICEQRTGQSQEAPSTGSTTAAKSYTNMEE